MKSKKRNLRYWIVKLHLWLGLGSGLVVFIVSITGCLFVFEKEINGLVYKNIFTVAPQTAKVPLSAMLHTAQNVLGEKKKIYSVTAYKKEGRAWEFMTYKGNDTAATYFGAVEHYESIFINPHTGAVTGRVNYKYNFFSIVKYIHWSLLLNTKYGQPVVGYSTLVFVVLLFTGLVLWWPKKWNKPSREKSFSIKWKASFKRVNYDLHNVPGFYILLPALVIALTGLVFAFSWFSAAVYVAGAGTFKQPVQQVLTSVAPAHSTTNNALDIAYTNAVYRLPEAARFNITPASGADGVIHIYGYSGSETYYNFNHLQYNQYTGTLLGQRKPQERNGGEKLLDMNYDIHIGAIAGLPGKIIAFITSGICATLPLTGFLIWWGRRHGKTKPKQNRSMIKQAAVE